MAYTFSAGGRAFETSLSHQNLLKSLIFILKSLFVRRREKKWHASWIYSCVEQIIRRQANAAGKDSVLAWFLHRCENPAAGIANH